MALERFGFKFEYDTADAEKAAKRLESQEKELALAMWKSKSALDAKAKSLGLTTGELKSLAAKLSPSANKLKLFGDSAGKAGEGAAKLRGILSLVSPGLGEVAGFANDAADGVEVATMATEGLGVGMSALAPILLAAAAAAAPLAQAYAVMSRESAEASARAVFLATHTGDLLDPMRKLEDATLRAKVATHLLTDAQGKIITIQDGAARSVEDFEIAQRKEKDAANEAYFASKRKLDYMSKYLPDALATAIDYTMGYTSAQNEAVWQLDQLDEKERGHQEIVVKTTEETIKATKAEDENTAATKRRTEAMDALVAGLAKVAQMDASYRSIQATMLKTGEDATNGQLKGIAKVEAAERAKQAELSALHTKQVVDARGNTERLIQSDIDYNYASTAVTAAAEAEKTKIREEAAKKAMDILVSHGVIELSVAQKLNEEKKRVLLDYTEAAREAGRSQAEIASVSASIEIAYAKKVADAKKAENLKVVNATMQAAQQGLQVLGDAAALAYHNQAATVQSLQARLAAGEDTLTQKQKIAIEARIEQTKAGAKRAFALMKAARIAEAVVSTASATIAAYNAGLQVGGPAGLILGPVMAGIAAGAGAVQIATIASEQPSFYRGSSEILDKDPNGIPSTLHPREAVANERGAEILGRDNIRDANDGKAPSPQRIIVENHYQHQAFRPFIRKDLLLGGPLADAVRGNTIPGHREVRR